MADKYVDPAATGGGTGADWTNAWTTLAAAVAGISGGDTVYCRGTESASTALTVSGISGTYTAHTKFIGCNAGGTVDGTRYTFDVGSNAVDGFYWNGPDHVEFHNFEITSSYTGGTTCHGINVTSSYGYSNVYSNLYIHGFTGSGVNDIYLRFANWIGCRFSDNDAHGINRLAQGSALFGCRADANGTAGFNIYYSDNLVANCVAHDNTGNGFYSQSGTALTYINCVAHGNGGNGFSFTGSDRCTLIGCRFTGNTNYGFINNNTSYAPLLLGCYAQGNTAGNISGTYVDMQYKGDTAWNVIPGTDTDYGYVDSSSDDYNLADAATLRSKEFVIP